MAMHGSMSRTGNKKEKFDSASFGKLIKFTSRYNVLIIFSIICAIGSAVCTIIGPDKINELVNIITAGLMGKMDMDKFTGIAITLVIIYACGALFGYIQQYVMAEVTQRASRLFRTKISFKINRLPLKYFDTTTKGDILSRVTNDVDTISQTLGSNVANLFNSIVLFIGVLVMMFKTNYILSFVTIGSSIIGFILMAIIIVKSQKYFDLRQKHIGETNGHAEESFTNFKIIKAFNASVKEKIRFYKHVDDIYHATWRANFLSGLMMPIMVFSGNLGYAMIFIVGGILIMNGNTAVTIGTLSAFIIYARLFSQPLSTLAQSMSQLQQASAAGKRVFELLEQQEIIDESTKKGKLEKVKGDVEFRNVRFSYDSNKIIIKNFNVKLKAGQKIAIVGPTGAGKTTMVNLLMRFYEIKAPRLIINNQITNYKVFDVGQSIIMRFDDEGYLYVNGIKTKHKFNNKYPKNSDITFNGNLNSNIKDFSLPIVVGNSLNEIKNIKLGIAYYGDIFIDDTPIKYLTRNNIHDLFDMILQDTWLFNGSIKDNLIFNKEEVSNHELNKAIDAVGLTHFIKTLPNGLDTILGDIDSLSEGQKQQLTIARAMIKNSPLLILDEATSNVDTRTELVIQEAMDKLTKGRTSFVIAHRLSTIKNADIILVMRDGDIVEVGNHKELLKKKGFYAKIYNSQFEQI